MSLEIKSEGGNNMSKNANKSTISKVEVDETVELNEVEETSSIEVDAHAMPIEGIVTNCTSLNIRKEPSVDSDILCFVRVGTSLMIDESMSTEDWYNVYTAAGMSGFCMKNYVRVSK